MSRWSAPPRPASAPPWCGWRCLALVGENGSGKTTLAKLLAGLYLPAAGSARWDGRETRDLDPHALWRQVAVVPQDYARWPMTCRENITLGQPAPDGDAAVMRAAEASGAAEVVAKLRRGPSTLLAVESKPFARPWPSSSATGAGSWSRRSTAPRTAGAGRRTSGHETWRARRPRRWTG
ncbi:ATP-binding cassette domain-containing protein [Kitasatospora sp. NPDC056184]|uniref:ATP-binding cassette domain-containing protein n=1 Tax=Kitasatospora sp. NPDC056184 TaxID=3345738 RepID=UPI0035DCD087